MKLIEYSNGQEFLSINREILLKREAVSQLLLFNAIKSGGTLKMKLSKHWQTILSRIHL